MPVDVVKEIGEWDEDFFHGGEDFDMSHRIEQAGYNIIVARKSFIYHYGGASTRELFDGDVKKVRENVISKMMQYLEMLYSLCVYMRRIFSCDTMTSSLSSMLNPKRNLLLCWQAVI